MPVYGARGRFYDYRVLKSERILVENRLKIAFRRDNLRLRVKYPVPVAVLIEACLVSEPLEELRSDVRNYISRSQSVAVMNEHRRVIVRASESDQGRALMLLREVGQGLHHDLRIVELFDDRELYYPRIVRRADGVPSERVQLHAVLLVERPRDVVAVHIRADQHGYYVLVLHIFPQSRKKRLSLVMLISDGLVDEEALVPDKEGENRPDAASVVRLSLVMLVEHLHELFRVEELRGVIAREATFTMS